MSANTPQQGAASAAPPRVSVIIPAWGVAALLGEALDSLLAQDFADWEAVVIDDGSKDDVAGAVAPYLADPRIRFLATANHGVSTARNTAIAASSGDLITLLDGDDHLRPEYLSRIVAALDADPDAVLATCNAEMFGAVAHPGEAVVTDANHPRIGSLAQILDRSFNVYIGTTFRRSAFARIGGFDGTMAQSEDLDLWVRLMMEGGAGRWHAVYLDEILGEYRVRAGSASSNGAKMLRGNIRVYDKVIAQLGAGSAEGRMAAQLRKEQAEALAFEEAIESVIAGAGRDGVERLRRASRGRTGRGWQLAFAAWSLFPGLAAPMLARRQRRNARGGGSGGSGMLRALSIF